MLVYAMSVSMRCIAIDLTDRRCFNILSVVHEFDDGIEAETKGDHE